MNKDPIRDTTIYKEEIIKEHARLDEKERREELLEQQKKQTDSRKTFKNMVIAILVLIFMYFMLYKPLYEMFV